MKTMILALCVIAALTGCEAMVIKERTTIVTGADGSTTTTIEKPALLGQPVAVVSPGYAVPSYGPPYQVYCPGYWQWGGYAWRCAPGFYFGPPQFIIRFSTGGSHRRGR